MADSSSSEEQVVAPPKAVPAPVDSDSEDESAARVAQPPRKANASPKAKVAAKPVVDSDSDDESAPARPAKKAKTAAAQEDSSSEEEVSAKPKAKAVAKQPVLPTANKTEDSSSEDEVTAKPKAKAAAKAPVDSDSEDEAPAAKPAGKPAAEADDSDDSDDEEKPPVKSKAKLDAADKKKGDDLDPLRVIVKGIPWKVTEDEFRKYFASCGEIKHLKILVDKETQKSKGVAFITFANTAGVAEAMKRDGDAERFKGRTLRVERAEKFSVADTLKAQKQNKKKEKDVSKIAALTSEHDLVNPQMIEKMVHAQKHKDWKGLEALGEQIVKRAQAAQKDSQRINVNKKDKHEHAVFVKGLPFKEFDEEDFKKRFADCGEINFVWMPLRASGDTKGFGLVSFKTHASFEKALAYNGTKCKGEVLIVVKSTPPKQGGRKQGATEEPKIKTEEGATEVKREKKKRVAEEQPAGEEVAVKKKVKKDKSA